MGPSFYCLQPSFHCWNVPGTVGVVKPSWLKNMLCNMWCQSHQSSYSPSSHPYSLYHNGLAIILWSPSSHLPISCTLKMSHQCHLPLCHLMFMGPLFKHMYPAFVLLPFCMVSVDGWYYQYWYVYHLPWLSHHIISSLYYSPFHFVSHLLSFLLLSCRKCHSHSPSLFVGLELITNVCHTKISKFHCQYKPWTLKTAMASMNSPYVQWPCIICQ